MIFNNCHVAVTWINMMKLCLLVLLVSLLCWIQASDIHSNQDKTEVGITCVNVFQHLDEFNVIECL